MTASTICHGCGQRLEIPPNYARTKLRCPECGVMCEVEPQETRKAPQKKPARPSSPKPTESQASEDELPIKLAPEPAPPPRVESEIEFSDDPEDGKPYRVTGDIHKKCPECGRRLESKTTQCPGCGFDLATKKKAKKRYQPATLAWEAGWPYRKRLNLFVLGMSITLVLGVLLMGAEGQWGGMLLSSATFAGLSSFLLGTYPRVDLTRDQRGWVTLTKTWRACFLERSPIPFDVREFEGVRTGFDRDVHFLDWFIACMLLPVGIVPGIIWWYLFIQLDQHTVTLVKEHGYGSDVLYRGVSEKMAKDMARALEEVGGLPYENK
jgi:hypothetical protein